MRKSLVAIGALAVVVVLVVVAAVNVVGFTQRPFDAGSEVAVGKMENSLGDQYRLDAANLSATWTFNRDAAVVVRFDSGTAVFNGQEVPTGCYAGTVHRNDVMRFDGAHGVSFASPDTDTSCQALP